MALGFALLFVFLPATILTPAQNQDQAQEHAQNGDWRVRRFNATADQCYLAAERAITNHHEVVFQEPKLRVIRYEIGVTSLAWGYRMALRIEPTPGGQGCIATHEVDVKGGPVLSWGRGKKEVRQVYARMEEELAAMFQSEKKKEPAAAQN
jgi:hypothetical protein